MTATDPTSRRTERAAVAAEQVAVLYLQYEAAEVAAFLKTVTGDPRPETFCRPRHVKYWPADKAEVTS